MICSSKWSHMFLILPPTLYCNQRCDNINRINHVLLHRTSVKPHVGQMCFPSGAPQPLYKEIPIKLISFLKLDPQRLTAVRCWLWAGEKDRKASASPALRSLPETISCCESWRWRRKEIRGRCCCKDAAWVKSSVSVSLLSKSQESLFFLQWCLLWLRCAQKTLFLKRQTTNGLKRSERTEALQELCRSVWVKIWDFCLNSLCDIIVFLSASPSQ